MRRVVFASTLLAAFGCSIIAPGEAPAHGRVCIRLSNGQFVCETNARHSHDTFSKKDYGSKHITSPRRGAKNGSHRALSREKTRRKRSVRHKADSIDPRTVYRGPAKRVRLRRDSRGPKKTTRARPHITQNAKRLRGHRYVITARSRHGRGTHARRIYRQVPLPQARPRGILERPRTAFKKPPQIRNGRAIDARRLGLAARRKGRRHKNRRIVDIARGGDPRTHGPDRSQAAHSRTNHHGHAPYILFRASPRKYAGEKDTHATLSIKGRDLKRGGRIVPHGPSRDSAKRATVRSEIDRIVASELARREQSRRATYSDNGHYQDDTRQTDDHNDGGGNNRHDARRDVRDNASPDNRRRIPEYY